MHFRLTILSNRKRALPLLLSAFAVAAISACSGDDTQGTIGQDGGVDDASRDAQIDGGAGHDAGDASNVEDGGTDAKAEPDSATTPDGGHDASDGATGVDAGADGSTGSDAATNDAATGN